MIENIRKNLDIETNKKVKNIIILFCMNSKKDANFDFVAT